MNSGINLDTAEMTREIVRLQREHLTTVRETVKIHEENSDFSTYTSEIRQQTSDIHAQNEVMKNVTVQINNVINHLCEDIELKNVKISQELEETKVIIKNQHDDTKEKMQEVVNMIENILTS